MTQEEARTVGQIRLQLEKFQKYCEVYWDLVPVEAEYQSLVPIRLYGTESFYTAFVAFRGLIKYWGRGPYNDMERYPKDFKTGWDYAVPFYRNNLYSLQKRATKRRKRRERGERRRSFDQAGG